MVKKLILEKRNSGFTLIELLVVISIIGLLASTALASLSTARQNARDASIKQQMRALATTAELHRTATGEYNLNTGWIGNSGVTYPNCASETFSGPYAEDFRRICQGIEDARIAPASSFLHMGVHSTYYSATQNYSFMVLLNSGEWYCVGSSGNNYEGTAHPTTGPLYGTYNSWGGSGCFANP